MGNTYLLTWNPSKWDFEGGYKTFLRSVKEGENPIIEWRAANSSIVKGDTLFLMRLGEEPRGIILKGIAMGSGHPSKHYEADRAKAGEIINRVDVQFVSAGDYFHGEYIDWKVLKECFPDQNWTPQASGIKIKDEYCKELNELWNKISRRGFTVSNNTHSSNSESINVPMRPKNKVRKADGTLRYVCGRCSAAFNQAARCPECGQLIKN